MHKKLFVLLFLTLACSVVSAQDCTDLSLQVTKALLKAQHHLDSTFSSDQKPDYIETYLLYPVLNRYYKKAKNRDTAIVRKFEDFARTVWCFKGTCFNNNKSFYLTKQEVLSKINANELANNYQREVICMLCDKYMLDSDAVIKILDYRDTLINNDNRNAEDYNLLHKGMQLVNLKSKKCISGELYSRYNALLSDTICRKFVFPFIVSYKTNKGQSDAEFNLFMEALLMLSLLDDKLNISDELYGIVLQNQLSRGGWGSSTVSNTPDGHNSIVAYWLLLEAQMKLLKNSQ